MEHPKIQRTPDGALLLNFGRYGDEVEVAAISGDGRRVLTVHDVGTAEIWDASSGEKIGEIRPDSPLRGTRKTAPTTAELEVFIEGRLRASRFVGGEILLVNHEGQLFRSTLPAGAPSRRQSLDPEGERIDERAIQLARLAEDLP